MCITTRTGMLPRLALWGLAITACILPAAQVWNVEELEWQSGAHSDPYRQVELTATFLGPRNAIQTVRGFWDGGSRYRLRWTPVAPGRWTYRTQSNDPALSGKSGSFDVKPAPLTSRGFLRRDEANPSAFVFDNGERYFLFGTTLYGIVGSALDGGTWRQAIEGSARYGINKVRFYVNRWTKMIPGGQPTEMTAHVEIGDGVFLPGFAKSDEIVRLAARNGMVADLIVFFRDRTVKIGEEETKRYLRYVIARYGAFPNVIWCVQNEWEYSRLPITFWSGLGRITAAEDPWARIERAGRTYRRALSIHQQTRNDWQFNGEDWFTHAILQVGVRNNGPGAGGGDEWKRGDRDMTHVMRHGDDWGNYGILFNRGHGYPVVNDEYGYMGEPVDVSAQSDEKSPPAAFTREKHRRTMWGIYIAGGYGSTGDKYNYADGKPYTSGNWHEPAEFGDVARLVKFFTRPGVEYWRMVPANNIANGARNYVLADPGRRYFVYSANGGNVTLKLPPGQYAVTRYDPREGSSQPLPAHGVAANATFALPEASDWVLDIQVQQK